MYMQDNQQQQHQQRPQPQQDLLRDSSNNDTIPYRNFIHSIKSSRTRKEYVKSLRFYMNWLSIYDYNTILQKDPRLIASDIIDFIIYLKNDRKLAPATINLHVAALHHFYDMNDVELRWNKIKSLKTNFIMW